MARVDHEISLGNAASATTEASRNARATMRWRVQDLPGDKVPLRSLLMSVTDANGNLAGATCQSICARLVDSFNPAVASRAAFAAFFSPHFLDRLWPILEARIEEAEYLETLKARSSSHLMSMLLRAKQSAIAISPAIRADFEAGANDILYVHDIATRMSSQHHFAAANGLVAVDARRVATISLEDAHARGALPAILELACDRFARSNTNAGGDFHRSLTTLSALAAKQGGLPAGQGFGDFGSTEECVEYVLEALAHGKMPNEAYQEAGLGVTLNNFRRMLDAEPRKNLLAARLSTVVTSFPLLGR